MPVLAPESSAALVIAAALASESSLQWAAGGQCPGGHLPAAQSVLAFLGPPPLGQATRAKRTAGGAAHQKGYVANRWPASQRSGVTVCQARLRHTVTLPAPRPSCCLGQPGRDSIRRAAVPRQSRTRTGRALRCRPSFCPVGWYGPDTDGSDTESQTRTGRPGRMVRAAPCPGHQGQPW